MSKTKLIRCECEHDYQDKTYGHKIRVANEKASSKTTQPKFACTVCGKETDNLL